LGYPLDAPEIFEERCKRLKAKGLVGMGQAPVCKKNNKNSKLQIESQ
jgi:hypothetical protein